MATTANNGWTTPNDSDPFRNGALAIRTLGNAIDTSVGTGLLAWTSYTPTLSQGVSTNISKSITYAKYAKIGKTVFANIRLTATAAGTLGSAIALTLPVTAATSSSIIGSGEFFDSGVNNYSGFIFNTTTTTCSLVSHMNGESFVGTSPSFAVANNDILSFHLIYEGV